MHAAEDLTRGPYRVFERRHSLAEIVERRTVFHVERLRVNPPHPEREIITLSKNAPRDGHHLAQKRLGFFKALLTDKGRRVVVGCYGETLIAANNYAALLAKLDRFKETKKLLRKNIPVARRVLGETCQLTLSMRWLYSMALHEDPTATLDDLREAVTTLESVAKSYKRVLGESHPETPKVQKALAKARMKLTRARAAASVSKPPPT